MAWAVEVPGWLAGLLEAARPLEPGPRSGRLPRRCMWSKQVHAGVRPGGEELRRGGAAGPLQRVLWGEVQLCSRQPSRGPRGAHRCVSEKAEMAACNEKCLLELFLIVAFFCLGGG